MKNFILLVLVVLTFSFFGILIGNVIKDATKKENEENRMEIEELNEERKKYQGGWIQNYVKLSNVTYKEDQKTLNFNIENQSKIVIEDIVRVSFKIIKNDKLVIEKVVTEEWLSIHPLEDLKYNEIVELEKGHGYKVEVYVDYEREGVERTSYKIGESVFNVDF